MSMGSISATCSAGASARAPAAKPKEAAIKLQAKKLPRIMLPPRLARAQNRAHRSSKLAELRQVHHTPAVGWNVHLLLTYCALNAQANLVLTRRQTDARDGDARGQSGPR